MTRQRPDTPEPVSWLEVHDAPESGPAGPDRPQRGMPSRGYLAVLAVLLVLMAVGLVQRGRAASRAAGQPKTLAIPTTAPRTTSAAPILTPTPSPSPSTVVADLHRPLLPVPAGTVLFARGSDTVLRLELGTGRITTTTLPPLSSGGPTSFVVGADSVLIRPQDPVTGYRIIDGQPPVALDDQLITPGVVVSGPDPRHVWVQDIDGNSMRLVDFAGHPTGVSIRLPVNSAQPDGTGNLLFYDVGGAYEATPSGIRRITTGTVLAVGPTRFLVSECDEQYRCGSYVIDRVTGQRRSLGPRIDLGYAMGVISPDGSTAAIVNFGQTSSGELQLVDLATGRLITSQVTLSENDADSGYSQLAWSADSKWLFSAVSGALTVLDRAGRIHPLNASLPPITQLALRPTT